MASVNHPDGSFAALNEREREILLLLANGHTAKSIAARLGQSETAINERLRAARRKTGIGSSRELARLLDAQKNGDRKIDLSAPALAVEGFGRPETVGPFWSKGMIAMLIAMSVTAAGLVLAASPSATDADPTSVAAPAAVTGPLPLAGSWSVDVERIPEQERPRRVTITFRPSDEGKWTTLVEIVAPDGTSQHAESTAAVDGVPVPVTGSMAFIDTVALRQPASNTLVMTLGKNGAPFSTRVYTVAKDRKSMTETIVWAGDNLPKLETTHFSRID